MRIFGRKTETALVPQQASGDVVTQDGVVKWLKAFGHATALTESETLAFVSMATELQLNPFKREIHVSVYEGKNGRQLSIVVGYEVYIRRAERSGLLEWWTKGIEQDGSDWKAWVEIKRKDREKPFRHEVWMSEVRQGGPLWQRMPKFMAQKTCMAQAFRFAFPLEVGELPYTADEMPQGMGGEHAAKAEIVEEPIKLELHATEDKPEEPKESVEVPENAQFTDVVKYINEHQKRLNGKAPEYMMRAKKVKDGDSDENFADIIKDMEAV